MVQVFPCKALTLQCISKWLENVQNQIEIMQCESVGPLEFFSYLKYNVLAASPFINTLILQLMSFHHCHLQSIISWVTFTAFNITALKSMLHSCPLIESCYTHI